MTDLFNVSSPGSTHRQSVVAFRSHAGIANSFLVVTGPLLGAKFSWAGVLTRRVLKGLARIYHCATSKVQEEKKRGG